MQLCDTPDKAAAYWREHIPANPHFNRDVECFVVLLVNTRRKILVIASSQLARSIPSLFIPAKYSVRLSSARLRRSF
jgi:hypothetical protein